MNRILKKFMNNAFLKNTGWMVFAEIYQMAVSLIIGVISARYLGPSNYGTISYVASYVSFFTIICALGLESIVIKEMIANREEEGRILGSSIFMRILAGILSVASLCVIVSIVNPDDKLLLRITFLQSIALIFTAFNMIDAWYQSYLRSKMSAIVRCVAYTVVSLYKVVLLIFGKSVIWFAFSTSLDSIMSAALFMFFYFKQSKSKPLVDIKIMGGLLKQSYHLVIAYLMVVIYSQMDRLMIGIMIDKEHVGYYTAAATICSMWGFIPSALSNSARPIIMELKDKSESKYLERIKQLNCAIFWIGVVFAGGITLFSKLIISILYGSKYMAAYEPLVLIIWSTVFSSLSYPRSIWMICENKQSFTKKILMWGVITNFTLNAVLIRVWGISGAAVATLITEIVTCLLATYFYKDTRVFVRYLWHSISLKNLKPIIS